MYNFLHDTSTSTLRPVGYAARYQSVAGIAKQLYVSESTAKTHISTLYEKLGRPTVLKA